MPRWEQPVAGRHELNGSRVGARVTVMAEERLTLVTVVLVVDGTDEATVDDCKRQAERLLVEAQR